MKTSRIAGIVGGCAALAGGALGSQAGEISLFEYAINRDFVISIDPPPPPTFDAITGLGSIRMIFTELGPHYAALFVDHELSETENTFFNELGEVSPEAPPPGVTWEIDEPGYVSGDIYDNFLLGTLDNSVGLLTPDDVSMALGWAFNVPPGMTATLTFRLSDQRPDGFYLRHRDPLSGENVFFSGALRMEGGDGFIPEGRPVVAGGALAALAALSVWRLRRRGGGAGG